MLHIHLTYEPIYSLHICLLLGHAKDTTHTAP